MTGYEFGTSPTPEKQLAMAKDRFRLSILEDDTFFAFLQRQLPNLGERERHLPDFRLEPTIKQYPDETSDAGIRISRSGAVAVGAMTSSVTVYNHVPLFAINEGTSKAKAAPGLERYLVESGQVWPARELMFRKWQEAARILLAESPADTILDPTNGTFELESAEKWNTPRNN